MCDEKISVSVRIVVIKKRCGLKEDVVTRIASMVWSFREDG